MSTQRRRRTAGGGARKLASGRWQVRVTDRVSGERVVLGTYPTKADADVALARALADQSRGGWVPPKRAEVTVAEYARAWLDEHPSLAPRTRERYDGLLRLYLEPQLGRAAIGDLTPEAVRRWLIRLQRAGVGDSTRAKAYRFLRGVLNGAVNDELLMRNPCRVPRAGLEHPDERPIATVPQVYALADAVPRRYRALVMLAAFSGLRLGELAALTRADVDLLHGAVRVDKQLQRLADGSHVVVRPKSDAGRRTVALPPQAIAELEEHLAAYVGPERGARVFAGPHGGALDRSHWGRTWREARSHVVRLDATLPEGLRFHDLRHTGNTLAASTGASTRELMVRMGHSSTRAAMIYQHATDDRDQAIARALGDVISRSAPARVIPIDARAEGR